MADAPDAKLGTSHSEVVVRFCETDMMGVVHHANYLVYCEAARVDWLHKRGVRYADWELLGVHLPVVEARVRFRQPARFQDRLAIETTLVELSRVAVRFRYASRAVRCCWRRRTRSSPASDTTWRSSACRRT